VTLFDTIAKQIYAGFKGKLLTGTLSRSEGSGADEYGDPTSVVTTEYSCQGFIEDYSLYYRASAGIPDGDVRITLFAQSLAVTPTKDDKITMRDQQYQVRQVRSDPAQATWELQAFPL